MLRLFVGYDSREAAAYHVFAHSVLAKASRPIAVTPVVQEQLRGMGLYTRPVDTKAATSFSLTRFLVPALCNYEGFAVFADCDMLAQTDFNELLDEITVTVPAWQGAPIHETTLGDVERHPRAFLDKEARGTHAVWVCQHDYVPKATMKMDSQQNAAYPRKNWSSFIVFDCARCKQLTPEYVNSATPAELHRFSWLQDEEIGSLPLAWNWLIGEYPRNANAKNLHYTLGGPYLKETADCEQAKDWLAVWYTLELPVRMAQQLQLAV